MLDIQTPGPVAAQERRIALGYSGKFCNQEWEALRHFRCIHKPKHSRRRRTRGKRRHEVDPQVAALEQAQPVKAGQAAGLAKARAQGRGQLAALRSRGLPALPAQNLRDCQVSAVTGLEASLARNQPRALVHMATGSGKTFTAITSVYRLLKFGGAKRVLFLVDTRNLGIQAHQEFAAYTPPDDGRKFTELYNVQRLNSPRIDAQAQVCISTIQRMYAILANEHLAESAEDISLSNLQASATQPKLVRYNPVVPVETFDFIVIDECHRSIYNLWKQVLDYFDAFLIGLTATPDKRTFGFFDETKSRTQATPSTPPTWWRWTARSKRRCPSPTAGAWSR